MLKDKTYIAKLDLDEKGYIIGTQLIGDLLYCKDCRFRGNQYGKLHYCRVVSNVMPDHG